MDSKFITGLRKGAPQGHLIGPQNNTVVLMTTVVLYTEPSLVEKLFLCNQAVSKYFIPHLFINIMDGGGAMIRQLSNRPLPL